MALLNPPPWNSDNNSVFKSAVRDGGLIQFSEESVTKFAGHARRSPVVIPANLYSENQPDGDKRRILEFELGEILLEHGIVHRIEFTEKRCNLTLKNVFPKRKSVHVRVWILNKALIELWRQTERWNLTSLQPDQSHLVSWEFNPAVPDVVWNQKAREVAPAWIIVDVL